MSLVSKDLCWLAGLLEGEGCFTTEGGVNGHRPMITLSMTDEDVVRRAKDLVELGEIYEMKPHKSNYKKQWRWKIHKQSDAAGLMMTLYPLLGTRRKARIRGIIQNWKHNLGSHAPRPWQRKNAV